MIIGDGNSQEISNDLLFVQFLLSYLYSIKYVIKHNNNSYQLKIMKITLWRFVLDHCLKIEIEIVLFYCNFYSCVLTYLLDQNQRIK